MTDKRNQRVDAASRVIKGAPEAIYRAFIDPAALKAWLPPAGMTGEFQEFEAREGGQYVLTLTYESAEHAHGKASANTDVVKARFAELVPNVRVVQLVDFESADPAFAGTMRMTWALRALADDATEVSFKCEDVPSGISPEDHAEGLASSLANLAAYIEG